MYMSKKKDARQRKIRQILLEEDEVRVLDLAKRLQVTPETLRKDLDEMENQHIVVREHGVARIQKLRSELPIAMRNQEHPEMKRRITLRAIQEIEDGQIVFLDAGSTLLQGIQALRSKKDLTIVVNSLPIALECITMNVQMIFVGGMMQKNGLRTDGYFTSQMLDHIHIDVAILGTDGILDANGFTVYTLEEVGTRRHIMKQAKKCIAVCDSSKFESSARYQFCTFDEVDMMITNPLSEQQRERVKDIKKVIEV